MANTNKMKPRSMQKKQVAKAAAAKPAPRKAAPVKKASAPARKPAPAAAKKPAPAPRPAAPKKKPAAAAKPKAPAKGKASVRKPRFSKADLKHFQMELIAMRDRITNQSGVMKSAALQRSDEVNLEEDGTDAFLRLQTLEQVGTQQGIVTKIDEAIHAISKGTYGICDACGELISKARLTVLPFARNCIKCQAEMEERSSRYGRHR